MEQKAVASQAIITGEFRRLVSRAAMVYSTVFANSRPEHLRPAAILFLDDGSDELVFLPECGNPRCYVSAIANTQIDPDEMEGVVTFTPSQVDGPVQSPYLGKTCLLVHVELLDAEPLDLVLPDVEALRQGVPASPAAPPLTFGTRGESFERVDILAGVEALYGQEEGHDHPAFDRESFRGAHRTH